MAAAVSDESTRLCSSCEESIAADLLYKCTQCNVSDDPTKPVEFLCDVCVGFHIKKGHNVLDHRNMEPAVCPDHKQLCLDYCITCSETFCSKCLEKHRKHDTMLLDKKASELRSKVFELLTNWEKNEKMALKKSEDASSIVDVHEKEVEQMIKEVESTLDGVKNTLIAEIRAKFTEFSDARKWLKDHVQKIGQTQTDLRGLLCKSNGTLVTSFSAVEADIESFTMSHLQVEKYHMNEEKFETRKGFKLLIKKTLTALTKELNLPEVKNENPGPAVAKKSQPELKAGKVKKTKPSSELKFKSVVGCFTDDCYEVTQKGQIVEVRIFWSQIQFSSSKFSTQRETAWCLLLAVVLLRRKEIIQKELFT